MSPFPALDFTRHEVAYYSVALPVFPESPGQGTKSAQKSVFPRAGKEGVLHGEGVPETLLPVWGSVSLLPRPCPGAGLGHLGSAFAREA